MKYFEVLARVARRRLFWPAAFGLFLLYACLPLLNEQAAIENAQSSHAFASAIDTATTNVKMKGPGNDEERYFLYSISPFAQVSIPYYVSWIPDQMVVRSHIGKPMVSLKLDQVSLVGAMIIMLALTQSMLFPKTDAIPASVALEQPSVPVTHQHTNARQVFHQEVKLAEYRAETLFKRSTYLLTGGVLMAFVGVAVFYATLPEPLRVESSSSYLIRSIRSAGMLIFLEAIAWFLLRQYRNLVEDFKSFHRIYMKRANYLAAITILDKEVVRAEDLLLITALLGEDLTGKLSPGETTESLENMKNEGVNPVFNLVQDVIAKAFARSTSSK